MNCRPGDLAILIEDLWLEHPHTGERKTFVASGALVRVVNLDPEGCWNIEEPRRFQIVLDGPPRIMLVGVLTAIRDGVLRPIRPQADDAVDEMVLKVGRAPMTLTEIWEAAHG